MCFYKTSISLSLHNPSHKLPQTKSYAILVLNSSHALKDDENGLLTVVMYGTLAVVAAVDAILAVVGVVFPLLGSCG